jgi:hypothetical protein
MSRKAEPAPGAFSNAVVDALKDVLDNDNRFVVNLVQPTGLSNNYLAERFRKEKSFTLSDIELICNALDLDCADFLGNIPTSEVADNVTHITNWGTDKLDGIEKKAALHDEEMDTDE